ncbi:MAG TPA: pitrilysin family protein [Gemmatimonadales bacterium]|nr:pitrilysin family protein [Gemmatimonadales bacterium]
MHTVRLDEGLHRSVAPNGLIILSERLPALRSVAMGIWVRTASAHEPRGKMGVSHLLEHMVFKGTERRSARQIALELEVRGGSLDAYTGRDNTSFQAHVLDEDLLLAVDILTDLVRRPLLRQADLMSERRVVIEEISGVEDTPDDIVFDLHSGALWPAHPYGYSILGSRESVSALETGDLRAVHSGAYYPGNCVIAAAGNVDHARLLAALGREGWFDEQDAHMPLPAVCPPPAAERVDRVEERDTAQCHIVFGTDAFAGRDPRRFGLAILCNVLGGGMSSRLFQRVREELGLAYTVYAYNQLFQSGGQVGVYVGTQPASAAAAAEAIRAELDRLAANGLTPQELEDGKRQLKGQIVLALENPVSRMGRLVSGELMEGRYRPVDEVLGLVDAVTPAGVAELAAEFFPSARQTMLRLGPDA